MCKKYLTKEKVDMFVNQYEECSKMPYGLEQSLSRTHKGQINLQLITYN